MEDVKEAWMKQSGGNVESEHSIHVAHKTNAQRGKKKSSKNMIGNDSRSCSTDEWSDVIRSISNSDSSSSSGSLHNDCSRYDNVPIGLLIIFIFVISIRNDLGLNSK